MNLKQKLKEHRESKRSESPPSPVESINEFIGAGESDMSILNKDKAVKEGRFISLPPSSFYPDPNQPRKTFEEADLISLMTKIENNGQIQPIAVNPADSEGKYKIIAGERRWRAISASKKVATIDAVIITAPLDKLKILKLQLQENDERVNLNAIESANAIMEGVQMCKEIDPSYDERKIAEILEITSSTISKARALIKSPDLIQSLSNDDYVQDSETLYELTKLYKKAPEEAEKLIESIRNDSFEGNIRKAVQALIKQEKEKTSDESNSGNAKPEKEKDKDKITDLLPIIDSVSLDNVSKTLVLRTGKSSKSFQLSEDAYQTLLDNIGGH